MYILECKYNIYQYFLYGSWWAGGPVDRLRICRGPPRPPTVYATGRRRGPPQRAGVRARKLWPWRLAHRVCSVAGRASYVGIGRGTSTLSCATDRWTARPSSCALPRSPCSVMTHYSTRRLCLVPHTLGKTSFILGKCFN
jgi:hypothetical protein